MIFAVAGVIVFILGSLVFSVWALKMDERDERRQRFTKEK